MVTTHHYKAYAKINIFLKIVGQKDGYHLINSRFIKLRSLFDLLSLEPNHTEEFSLLGRFDCELEQNTIYKAYKQLCHIEDKVKQFYTKYSIKVEKNIPSFAGLGGASSDAATFLILTNSLCELNLSPEQLCKIGQNIGCDVPFFLSGYSSANVSGFGQIIEPFDESDIQLDIYTPDIKCSTAKVYQKYSQTDKPSNTINPDKLSKLNSKDILNNYNIYELNDLYLPATKLYKELENYSKDWFFSGSGSTVFKLI